MLAAGVDGCPRGWICVTRRLDRGGAGEIASGCYESAEALLLQQPRPDLVGIDMPIGLPAQGAREADRAARKLLGRRGSSVFPAPLRVQLVARSWEEACGIRERTEGKRMSKQAFAILHKVRELDAALLTCPAPVREVHPEVSFRVWAGRALQHAKRRAAGRRERERLVASHFGEDAFPAVRERYLRKHVASDDILDAFAALWTAERILAGRAETLPADPPRDETGLPMEIVY